MGKDIPIGRTSTGRPDGSRRFTGPQAAHHWPSVTLSPPWPPVISRRLPPSQMFKAGGGSGAWPGPMGSSSVWRRKALPPTRQGVPWRWSWASAAQTGNPGGGKAEGRADTSWPAGWQEMAMATSPGHWGAVTLSSQGCCGPEPPCMGVGI